MKLDVTHPLLLGSLAKAGHGSKILVADGNYPVATATNPMADVIYLNLARDLLGAGSVVSSVAAVVPLEAATVMSPGTDGDTRPEIWSEFAAALSDAKQPVGEFDLLERNEFYTAASKSDVAVVVATGEARTYANILLTIGVCV